MHPNYRPTVHVDTSERDKRRFEITIIEDAYKRARPAIFYFLFFVISNISPIAEICYGPFIYGRAKHTAK